MQSPIEAITLADTCEGREENSFETGRHCNRREDMECSLRVEEDHGSPVEPLRGNLRTVVGPILCNFAAIMFKQNLSGLAVRETSKYGSAQMWFQKMEDYSGA